MRAEVKYIQRIYPNRVEVIAEGNVSTRPRFSYTQKIVMEGRKCPEFAFKHPVPEYYSWDHGENEENVQDIYVETVLSRPVGDFPEEIRIHARQWSRKRHVWREMDVNGTEFNEEIWYQERWDHGILYKDIWIQWNRGEAKEEVHVEESDGLRERYFFKRAKQIIGPPGFFWYKGAEAQLSEHLAARIWRFALAPELFKRGDKVDVVGQDFGYDRWPSNLWLKIAYDRVSGIYWQAKETIENREDHTEISGEIRIEEKKIKI